MSTEVTTATLGHLTASELQAAVSRFLGCTMKVEQTVENPSQWLVARVEGEVQGFARAKDLLRHCLNNPEPATDDEAKAEADRRESENEQESEREQAESAAEIRADWDHEDSEEEGRQ